MGPIIALLTMAPNKPSHFVLMLVLLMKNTAPYESKVVAKRGNKPASVGTSQTQEPTQFKFGNNSLGQEKCESNVLGDFKSTETQEIQKRWFLMTLRFPVCHAF